MTERRDQAASVGDDDDVGREHVEETVKVTVSDGGEEPVHDLLVLRRADWNPRASSRDMFASPVRESGGRRRGLPDRLRDLVVGGLEHLGSTNTARSAGPRVSSTVSIAIDRLSASSTSAATSGLVSSGSGSHSRRSPRVGAPASAAGSAPGG